MEVKITNSETEGSIVAYYDSNARYTININNEINNKKSHNEVSMIKYEADGLGYISVVEVSDKRVGSNNTYISETNYVNSAYNKGYGYIDTIKPKGSNFRPSDKQIFKFDFDVKVLKNPYTKTDIRYLCWEQNLQSLIMKLGVM